MGPEQPQPVPQQICSHPITSTVQLVACRGPNILQQHQVFVCLKGRRINIVTSQATPKCKEMKQTRAFAIILHSKTKLPVANKYIFWNKRYNFLFIADDCIIQFLCNTFSIKVTHQGLKKSLVVINTPCAWRRGSMDKHKSVRPQRMEKGILGPNMTVSE